MSYRCALGLFSCSFSTQQHTKIYTIFSHHLISFIPFLVPNEHSINTTTMTLLTKNTTTSGYNTIVADAADAKDAVNDHPIGENTTTIRKQNRRTMVLVIGGSVSTFVVGMLLFCATQASSSLPLSTPALSSLRTTALEDPRDDESVFDGLRQCYPNGHGCWGYPSFHLIQNGGCCDTATCVNNADFFGYVCVDDPTPAPTLSPTIPPTNRPTPKPCVHHFGACGVNAECCGGYFCAGGKCCSMAEGGHCT